MYKVQKTLINLEPRDDKYFVLEEKVALNYENNEKDLQKWQISNPH